VEAFETWPHVFVPGEPGTPVLLALHGTGADEHDLVGLAGTLSPGSPVLSPRGRVSENELLSFPALSPKLSLAMT